MEKHQSSEEMINKSIEAAESLDKEICSLFKLIHENITEQINIMNKLKDHKNCPKD